MIVFYAEDGFALNLTNTKITLVEENPLFFNYFVRNYTWPFTTEVDDETSQKLNFLDLENSYGYKTKYYGKLQIDNTFDEAYLLISNHEGNIIEGAIYYGKSTFALLDKQLSSLPFPVISTETNLVSHAKTVIAKQYPEVGYNFPMVINEKFKENTKYKKFEGILNQYKRGNFVTNSNQTENGETVAYNRNVVTPFAYLMHVLEVGFASENMIMRGSFVTDKINEKILLFSDKYLEHFYSGLPQGFQFNKASEVWQDGVVSANFSKGYNLSQTGSYSLKVFLNIPTSLKVSEFKITHKGEVIFSSTANTINQTVILNLENSEDVGYLNFSLKLKKFTSNPSNGIGSIKPFNDFSFSFSNGQLNVFPNNFSLSEVMPDITFGTLLNKIKNWFNLEITFEKNIVNLNYIESKFLELDFIDETAFEIPKPKREFSQNKLYELKTDEATIYIVSTGITNTKDGYRSEDIIEIDMGISKMQITEFNAVFTATTTDTSNLQFLLYDGLKNDLPVAVSQVFSRKFTLNEAYGNYWKKWLHYRLNSETFKDKFPANVLDDFNINKGRFKYNKKHLYKTIKKQRLSENVWQLEVESESIN